MKYKHIMRKPIIIETELILAKWGSKEEISLRTSDGFTLLVFHQDGSITASPNVPACLGYALDEKGHIIIGLR